MLVYARNNLWDFVLCVIAATSLAFTLSSGFYATQPFQDIVGTALTAGACALVTLALFAVSKTSRTALIGGPLLAVALVGAVVASYFTSLDGGSLEDVPGNYLYFSLVTIASTVVVYVLSRWRAGALLLLVLGVFLSAAIEYLYWYGHYAAFVVFCVAAVGLYAFRTYQRSLLASSSDHLAFGAVTAFGVVLALASVMVGIGVFAVAIAPLNPPNVVMKLSFQELRAQEREVKGVASTDEAPAQDQYSTVLSNEIIYSSDVNEDLYDQFGDSRTGHGNASVVQVRNSSLDLGSTDGEEEGTEESLGLDWPDWLWLAVLISLAVLILGVILVRKLLRRRTYRKLVAGSDEDAVESLYRFFLSRFERLKMPQPGSMTLAEYASNNAEVLNRFGSHASTPAFDELTGVYTACVFGGCDVSDEEAGMFKRYYRVLYGNARRFVGRIRYLWTFFRI